MSTEIRSTRRIDNSAKYSSLLSKSVRETRQLEAQAVEAELDVNSTVFPLKELVLTSFTLSWRTHQISGKKSYIGPWLKITEFVSNITTKLAERFPPEPFLNALQIFNPLAWMEHRLSQHLSRISL